VAHNSDLAGRYAALRPIPAFSVTVQVLPIAAPAPLISSISMGKIGSSWRIVAGYNRSAIWPSVCAD